MRPGTRLIAPTSEVLALLRRSRLRSTDVVAQVPGVSLVDLASRQLLQLPLVHTHPKIGRGLEVYPLAHGGTLNFGLSEQHFLTPHPNDPSGNAGYFPSIESLDIELDPAAKGQKSPCFLANLRGGLVTDTHDSDPNRALRARVVTLRPETILMRFSDPGPGRADGPWWTSPAAFLDILMAREARADAGRIGVKRGVTAADTLSFLERAREYSQVLRGWSGMDMLYVRKVYRPIRVFLGVGKATIVDGTTGEAFEDANFQLYVPSLGTEESRPFISPPVVYRTDEVISKGIPFLDQIIRSGATRQQIAEAVAKALYAQK